MGFLDKLRRITFGKDVRELKEEREAPRLPLLRGEESLWAGQLLRHKGIEQEFSSFQSRAETAKAHALAIASSMCTEERMRQVPERARTVTALHANQYAAQLRKLLESVSFPDALSFEARREEYVEASEDFQDRTRRNAGALREHMGAELSQVEASLKEIEDAGIALMQALEERQIRDITLVHEAHKGLEGLSERSRKHEELLSALREELEQLQGRKARITEKIAQQRTLVRNGSALDALERLSALETEVDTLTGKHVQACQDAARYYQKHPQLVPPREAAKVMGELPKDPARTLSSDPARVREAFEELADALAAEHGGIGNLLSRLRAQADAAERDGARIAEILPGQGALRREMMKDIAALSMYDQQQFLLRARREEERTLAKIAYVESQLDASHRIALERQMRDAAMRAGARIDAGEEDAAAKGASAPADDGGEEHNGDDAEDDDTGDDDPLPAQARASVPAQDDDEDDLDPGEELSQADQGAQRAVMSAQDLVREAEEELARERKGERRPAQGGPHGDRSHSR